MRGQNRKIHGNGQDFGDEVICQDSDDDVYVPGQSGGKSGKYSDVVPSPPKKRGSNPVRQFYNCSITRIRTGI